MFLIVLLLVICVSAKNVPLVGLSIGDTVNIQKLSYHTNEILGDVFNGFDGKKFIEQRNFTSDFYSKREMCLRFGSLESQYHFLNLYIDDTKVYLPSLIRNSPDYNFDIDSSFIEGRYFYSVIKVCLRKAQKYLKIKVYDINDLSKIGDPINLSVTQNTTGVLRFRKNSETHYISAVTTGECLFQAFVHTAKSCDEFRLNNSLPIFEDSLFDSSVYKSRIITASRNETLENIINHRSRRVCLLTSERLLSKMNKDFLDGTYKNAVIEMDFKSLPMFSKLPSARNLTIDRMSLKFSHPGNIFDMHGENTYHMFNFGGVQNEYKEPPSMVRKYTNCYENELEEFTLGMSDSKEPNSSKRYLKLSIFNQMIKSYNYGVDEKYLNDNYKCLKTTLCSELTVQNSDIPNFRVVNLFRGIGENDYNVFENENIMFVYRRSSKTYHVRSVETGDCIFQALMYPASVSRYEVDYFHEFPVQRGRILSASGDRFLENRVKIHLASEPFNIFESLFSAHFNVFNSTLPLLMMLSRNKVTINIDLNEMDYP